MSATWLHRYGEFVAKHRLRRLIREELAPEHRPVLALLLDIAHQGTHPARFASIIKDISPHTPPGPLFDVERLGRIPRRSVSSPGLGCLTHMGAVVRADRVQGRRPAPRAMGHVPQPRICRPCRLSRRSSRVHPGRPSARRGRGNERTSTLPLRPGARALKSDMAWTIWNSRAESPEPPPRPGAVSSSSPPPAPRNAHERSNYRENPLTICSQAPSAAPMLSAGPVRRMNTPCAGILMIAPRNAVLDCLWPPIAAYVPVALKIVTW